MIIDTHAHITDLKFDADREIVIQKAFDLGVERIFEIACETCYWDKALKLSKRENIFVSFGIHPNNASKTTQEDLDRLETLIQNEKCIAVGEIGLDYHYDSSQQNINIQKEIFIKQLNIADKYNKPVCIHCRDAYSDIINMFKDYRFGLKGIVHCFLGTVEQARFFIETGFLLGVNGILTYKNSYDLKRVVFETGINNLVIETDCPYLAPQKYRGQRNEPSYIIETLEEIAAIKKISLSEAVQITTQNALKLL